VLGSFDQIAEDWTVVEGELDGLPQSSALLERELDGIMPEGCALALTIFDQVAEDWTVVEGKLDGLPQVSALLQKESSTKECQRLRTRAHFIRSNSRGLDIRGRRARQTVTRIVEGA
jgi:hypothetical protein